MYFSVHLTVLSFALLATTSCAVIINTKTNVNVNFNIKANSYSWRGNSIAYEYAESTIERSNDSDIAHTIVLLNGFGVGCFHQHRLMTQLLKQPQNVNTNINIYAIDYLGQGKSWPIHCNDGLSENERGLVYSADMWLDQLQFFMEQIIVQDPPRQVHIIGNSVGGHLAVLLAQRLHTSSSATSPSLASLVLLNATPVWGLNLPGWSGHLPPPPLPRWIGRKGFDFIRDLSTIDKYLTAAYVHRAAFIDPQQEHLSLPHLIRSCTLGPGGHAAFASILWSPPAAGKGWYDQLKELPFDCLLVFGAQDPWCSPVFAKKILESLPKYDRAKRYLELDQAGHCPNHEAPQAVATAVTTWIHAKDKRTVEFKEETFSEPWGDIRMVEKQTKDIPMSFRDWLAVTFV